MDILDRYFDLRRQVFAAFAYAEDWRVLPLTDARAYYWRLIGAAPRCVRFAETQAALDDDVGDLYYEYEIYTQRYLPRAVYREADYTLMVLATHLEGHPVLRVFTNAREYRESLPHIAQTSLSCAEGAIP